MVQCGNHLDRGGVLDDLIPVSLDTSNVDIPVCHKWEGISLKSSGQNAPDRHEQKWKQTLKKYRNAQTCVMRTKKGNK